MVDDFNCFLFITLCVRFDTVMKKNMDKTKIYMYNIWLFHFN